MTIDIILKAFDEQIAHLQSVRAEYLKVTLPKKSHHKQPAQKRTHTISAEGRKRIAAAARRRWAKQKKAAK
jgi:hypothetical protein